MQIVQKPGRSRDEKTPYSWPEASAAEQNIILNALAVAADFARSNKADSLLVLRNGKLVFEQYWNGRTSSDLQQTYSGTKVACTALHCAGISFKYRSGRARFRP
jgi:hypothetical protein